MCSVLTKLKDQKRRSERVSQRATLFRSLNSRLNEKLSFAEFVKQERDATAAAADESDRLFHLLTDDELVTEKLVRRTRYGDGVQHTRGFIMCFVLRMVVMCSQESLFHGQDLYGDSELTDSELTEPESDDDPDGVQRRYVVVRHKNMSAFGASSLI